MAGFNPFLDAGAADAFDAFPASLRQPLLEIRQLIFDTSYATPGVGQVVETLKWGEPAYITQHPRTETTLRLNRLRRSATGYALYVPCQTTLVASFREIYPDVFEFQGNRAMMFDTARAIALQPLRHCIALALTYHVRQSKAGRTG